ncbi:MAG TPA: ABC transporter permease, partial [Blastocatellia bacterium]|nr:ABC transporter permease [Blastocatellia bacterium]
MKKPGFWSRRRDRDLDDEIRSHLEMAVRERVERGEDPAEAANSARREFGNVGLVKEAAQQEWGWVWLDQLMQDTRHGLRILRLEPGFTVAAVLTLALGIGATSLVFSVVESVLLKSLPYPDAGRLMLIHESLPKAPQLNVSWPDFQDLRAQTKVFEDIAAFQVPGNVTMAASSGPKTVQVNYVSPSLFSMLGIRPVLGRTFADDEDKAGSGLPAVVSYRFWRDELGGDQNAIGRTLLLNGGSIPIIGILPPAPKYEPWGADVHFPIGFLANSPNFSDRGNHPGIVAIGRRRPGASLSQTQMDMDRIMNLLGDEYPASNRGEQVVLSDLNEWMTGGYRTELLMLLAGVGLVLLLASANVANLLLSRSVKRDQEFAVRAALGASPARIARQLIVESLIISLIGGAAGILLASAAMAPLVRLSPYNIPRLDEAHLDARVLLVAL